jgi:proteasome lid subunit RPN8/RPN11
MTAVTNEFSRMLSPGLPEELIYSLKMIAASSPDKEICGLIYRNNEFCPIANDADDSTGQFHMSAASLRIAFALYGEDDVTGVYHSHPSGCPYMSDTDLTEARKIYGAGCPWRYYIVTAEQITEYRYIT